MLTLHAQQEICNLCICDYIFYLIEFLIIPGSPFLCWFPILGGKYLRNEQQQEVNEVEKFWSQSACSHGQVSALVRTCGSILQAGVLCLCFLLHETLLVSLL